MKKKEISDGKCSDAVSRAVKQGQHYLCVACLQTVRTRAETTATAAAATTTTVTIKDATAASSIGTTTATVTVIARATAWSHAPKTSTSASTSITSRHWRKAVVWRWDVQVLWCHVHLLRHWSGPTQVSQVCTFEHSSVGTLPRGTTLWKEQSGRSTS